MTMNKTKVETSCANELKNKWLSVRFEFVKSEPTGQIKTVQKYVTN
jgi:hypothetical protein